MVKIRRALVSVSDKKGIVEFVAGLSALGVHIISTGGTAKLLRQNGVAVTEISDYTGFPEIMDGRVKTLHPKVHGGLLCVRDNPEHCAAMERLGILPIDMVVVNLYPFEATIAKPNVTFEEAIENIDIGGPSMLRSAAKNHKYVAVVVNPDRYHSILEEMRARGGALSEATLAALAREAFATTAAYDTAIARYLNRVGGVDFPDRLSFSFVKKCGLRYGENPHQKAAFYVETDEREPSVATAEILHGKELSYNNIMDLDAGLEIVKEFDEPAIAIIKHTNPCGAACAESLAEAFDRAYQADPLSAFGCVIAANRVVDKETAELMVAPGTIATKFVECIIAPDFASEAHTLLTTVPKWRNSVRLVRTGHLEKSQINKESLCLRRVVGGLLVQTRDSVSDSPSEWKVVTRRTPTSAEMEDLIFAWRIVKHVKSNAIVLAKNKTTVGVGAGQMSRVDASLIAARKAGERAKGAVLASDALFPFRDGVDAAADVGATAVIQPGGSVKDDEIIAAANERGLAMVFTGTRHFKH